MTISSEDVKVQYAGDGATVSFPVTFIFWNSSDLRVILTDSDGVETVWTENTQYTVSGGNGSTGTLTVDTSPTDYTPASGETLTILSDVPLVQEVDLVNGGAFDTEAVEEQMDKTVRLVQQQQEALDRSLKLKESSTTTGLTLPEPVADNFIGWNEAGDDLENKTLANLQEGTDLDIVLSGLTSGDLLKYDGTNWRNTASGTAAFVDTGTEDDEVPTVSDIDTALNPATVNHIHNPTFSVVRYATTPFTSTSTIPNDDDTLFLSRWRLLSDGDDILDLEVDATSGRSSSASNALRMVVETASKKAGIIQTMSWLDARALHNQKVSLSLDARTKTDAEISQLKCALLAWEGNKDVHTTDVVSAWNDFGTDPTLVSGWSYVTTPVAIDLTAQDIFPDGTPSAWPARAKPFEGVTMGPTEAEGGDDFNNIAVFFWIDEEASVDDVVEVTGIQLEVGERASPFSPRSFSEETGTCDMFGQAFANGVSAFAIDTTRMYCWGTLRRSMRDAPTSVLVSGDSITFRGPGGNKSPTSPTISSFSSTGNPGGFSFNLDGFTGLTAGDPYGVSSTGRWLFLDADL